MGIAIPFVRTTCAYIQICSFSHYPINILNISWPGATFLRGGIFFCSVPPRSQERKMTNDKPKTLVSFKQISVIRKYSYVEPLVLMTKQVKYHSFLCCSLPIRKARGYPPRDGYPLCKMCIFYVNYFYRSYRTLYIKFAQNAH